MRRALPTIAVLAGLAALAGCQPRGARGPTPPPPPAAPRDGGLGPVSFAVRSPAFADGELIPKTFTCDDRGVSPPISWEAPPPRTRSLALVVEDPDAPVGATSHWLVWNIPASARALPEGEQAAPPLREGAVGDGRSGWRAPCPPPGRPHYYHFRLYALDSVPDVAPGADRLHLHAAMLGHILAESILTGRYDRAPR